MYFRIICMHFPTAMNSINPLIQQFKKYGTLSSIAETAIEQKTKIFIKKKNDHFLKQGQLLTSYFVVKKGVFRAYINRNEKEINVWFGEENQIFGAIMPMYANKPSPEYIQFLEDSEVYAIAVDDLDILYEQYPELNRIGRKIAEELCVILEDRITSLHTESATERYQSLMEQQPSLVQRINLGHIASFLRVTQETLSRIRKR
ncbi:Crp/Fnr family transcriptional regulator [Flavobacterium sp. N502540]|uniref:Crp/Fnr family transcriptional regulator n=1 Tax=Flavobacterium sp. N502540 TaxID=2986838 RepID=UPI002225A43A|nr:Crp/Fnr family transcriptional regulator [Flavobacterium sp. N502540]